MHVGFTSSLIFSESDWFFFFFLHLCIHVLKTNLLSFFFQIPEYCRSFDESEIADQAFSLIFAFDEIVALGYRENVNLAQIRTFTEMDSHEEKVFQAVRQVHKTIFILSQGVYFDLWTLCV